MKLIVSSLLLLVSACAVAATGSATAQRLDGTNFDGVLAKSGDVFISAQPDEDGLRAMKGQGVVTVVNLRTDQEMASVPFDESGVVQGLGMSYVHLPSGGPDAPYTPTTLARFAEVMKHARGGVLLHCKSAARASNLWVAYLVKYQGLTMDEAIRQGRSINFGAMPIEGFLQGEFEYRYVPHTGEPEPTTH